VVDYVVRHHDFAAGLGDPIAHHVVVRTEIGQRLKAADGIKGIAPYRHGRT